MKEYILQNPDSEFITEIRFSLGDSSSLKNLEWENSHEFWYDGEMFDLIEKKIEDNQIVLRCINDKKESSLVKLQEKINKEKQGEGSSKSKSTLLVQLIQSSFIATDFPMLHIISPKTDYTCPKDSYTILPLRDVLTPPPQEA